MSKKKNLEDRHMIISSDDEEEAESDDSDSRSEEDVPNAEAESGSDSGSETDMEEQPSKPVTVTTSSKPKNKEVLASSAAQSSSAAASTPPPPPALKSALKRPATASEGTSTGIKRAKTVEESDSKKGYFQRVWTEEDEIKLLQGLIDFNTSKGNPYNNMDEYFDSVKTSFSFEPSKEKFLRKIRDLRVKYLDKGPFTKDHDKESMGLAKFIWGPGSFAWKSAVVKSSNGKSKKKKKRGSLKKPVEEEEEEAEKDVLVRVGADQESPIVELESDWFEKSSIVPSIASHGLDEAYVKQKWSSTPMEDKKILEEMYKLLHNKKVEWVELETKFFYEFTSRVFKSS